MEFFQRAKVFRLKCSHHSKYLIADQDDEKVKQSRNNSSKNARWSYELVEGKPNTVRLRSCWSKKYLVASEDPFLLGMTGNKVLQTFIQGPALEWEVIKDGPYIKLRSHTGSFLRANPRVPPWRNSITHVEPDHWTATDNMVLWIVDIVEIDYQSTNKPTDEIMKESSVPSLSTVAVDHNSMNQHSDPNKLNSSLDGLEEDRDGASSEESTEHIHPIEVAMAKQTVKELRDCDFHTIQSSDRGEKLEKALKVLIADSDVPSQDLLDLQEKLEVMKVEHGLACKELLECSTFSTTRLNTMADLKKDAAKARELEVLQAELQTNKGKREELLKQLNEIDNIIKDAEKAQADNLADVEELISRMGQKSQKLEEMKNNEVSWEAKKIEANRMLERVEEDWKMLKTMFPDV